MTWYEYKTLIYGIIKEQGTMLKVKSFSNGILLGRATQVHEVNGNMYICTITAISFENHSVHEIISYVNQKGVEKIWPRHSKAQTKLF